MDQEDLLMATERFLQLSFITLIVIGFLAAFADGIARADFFHPFDPGVRGGTAVSRLSPARPGRPPPGPVLAGQSPFLEYSPPSGPDPRPALVGACAHFHT